VNALFESMSGITTTGATVLVDFGAHPRAVLLWRQLIQWLGILVLAAPLSACSSSTPNPTVSSFPVGITAGRAFEYPGARRSTVSDGDTSAGNGNRTRDRSGGGGPESAETAGSVGAASDRHDRVERHPTPGPGTSLRRWYRLRNPLRVVLNYAVILLCRISPSLRLKRWLLRRLGVTVGPGAAWGLESTPDVFWPDRITVESDVVVGYDATILCHEFLVDEYRIGPVRVGEGAMIGAGAVVLPGVEIGAGAQVAANSLVADDVPAGATVAGVPAERVD
jgi:acetyltransferase-like isoleucine patch superfamily enzyme